MKFSITLAVLLAIMISYTGVEAWGYGGWGGGYGGYGRGYGYGGYGMGYGGYGGMGYGGYGGYGRYGGYYGKRADVEVPTRVECLFLTKPGGINCNK